MKKVFSTSMLLGVFIFSAMAQVTFNSLDMAYPQFSQEEKSWLENTQGLYFEKVAFTDTSIGGYFFRGSGGIYSRTDLKAQYTYYVGTQAVGFEDYFSRIGLNEYVNKYYEEKNRNTTNKLLFAGIGLISTALGFWGEFDALDTNMDGKYAFGSEGMAWAICGVGIISGTVFLTISLSPWVPPVPPSEKKIAQLSNEKNSELLRKR